MAVRVRRLCPGFWATPTATLSTVRSTVSVPTGAATSRTYMRASDGTVLVSDSATTTVHGQRATHGGTPGVTASQTTYAYDHTGRLTQVQDTNTSAVCTTRSYTFDNPHTGQATTRYGWVGGKQRSSETLTGLTLMGMRLYDPAAGRFLSVDPIRGGNANAYDYIQADPLNQYDPDGKICWSCGFKAVGRASWKYKWDIALTAANFIPVAAPAVWAYRAYRIVKVARVARGMGGGIRASRATSWPAGRALVGRGSRSFGQGLGRISRNGLRQWRRPQMKADGFRKPNFQYRSSAKVKWKNNYHVYHRRWW
ncbi:RHS repeat-associated core domain-containing protein [Streptomyces sp. ISL-66]|uniref:RHS repeat-associated core domain-containing protein n=1 Tax=Streptomyces sp. ISL-66 TaxID=2819186 RepID=UPI001BED2191|nr:RHS repeat-associated core domain-containing protein [Streptomyces sp. ISL-66]